MSNSKITIEKLAEMVARGFEKTATKNDIAKVATKDDIKMLRFDLESTERKLTAKIESIDEKVDALEMADVRDIQRRVTVLEKDVGQIKRRHV